MAVINKVELPSGNSYDVSTLSIPFGQVDSTSTATAFTATIPGITELYDGVCVYLKNGVITSASGWTLNINNLGAKPVYQTQAAASRTTTIFNVAYTSLFVYNSSRVDGGCWDYFYGYNSDTNTTAYQVRANQAINEMHSALTRYKICFTMFDGTILPSTSVSNSTATTKTLTTEAFDPYGAIYYYNTTTGVAAGESPGASYMWLLYPTVDMRYTFNIGTTLVAKDNVYVKCSPQADGSVKLAGNDCIVQSLPNSDDGYVYIYLGKAYDTYRMTLDINHPIYYYKNGAIRLWNNGYSPDDDKFIITFTYDEGETTDAGYNLVADKTFDEIRVAYESSKKCIGRYVNENNNINVEVPLDYFYYDENEGSYTYYDIGFLSSNALIINSSLETNPQKYRFFELDVYRLYLSYDVDYSSSYGDFYKILSITDFKNNIPISRNNIFRLMSSDFLTISFDSLIFTTLEYAWPSNRSDGYIILSDEMRDKFFVLIAPSNSDTYYGYRFWSTIDIYNYVDENTNQVVDGVYQTNFTATIINTISCYIRYDLYARFYTDSGDFVSPLIVGFQFSLSDNNPLTISFINLETKDVTTLISRGADSNLWDKAETNLQCATISEIEEMCNALGFQSVTIDTSDYESIEG